MIKKTLIVFMIVMAFLTPSMAQEIYFEDFEDGTGDFRGGDIYSDYILDRNSSIDDGEREYFIRGRFQEGTVIDDNNESVLQRYESEEDTEASDLSLNNAEQVNLLYAPNYKSRSNTSERGSLEIRDDDGDLLFEMRHFVGNLDGRHSYMYFKTSEDGSEINPEWNQELDTGGDIDDGFPTSEFIEVDIKFNDNDTINVSFDTTTTEESSTFKGDFTYLETDSSDNIDSVTLKNSTTIDNFFVGMSEPDYTVSVPMPKAVDSKGLPLGSVSLINIVIGLLGLLVLLIPDSVFRGYDTFVKYVGGVVSTATTTLEILSSYIGWIQEVGVERLKELLTVIAVIFGLRYASVFKEAVDGQRSYMNAVEYVVADFVGKAESIERILYRSMDTITNITHLGLYLLEKLITIYRTIKNHIPVIG